MVRIVIMLVAVSVLSSCVKEDGGVMPPQNMSDCITWTVVSSSMQTSRALIEDDDLLKEACSTGGKSIGIWSACELDRVITKNVLGNETGDVSLIYRKDTEWDNYQWWTYGETASKWVLGSKYTFNAYFPMNVVNEIESSNVSTFVIEYNTERYQEDLMTAYAFVDTQAADFKQDNPVLLNMLHILSALRFQFSFINADGTTYSDSDGLIEFWIENTAHGGGIATAGILAFGTIDENGVMDGEYIHWYPEDYPEPSTAATKRKIYGWIDGDGLDFTSTATSRTHAVAYSTDYDGTQKYGRNNGWVLTIPQECDGTAIICFKLKSTGDLVHQIPLPSTTYVAGKRYTYDIRFGQTNVTLNLKIADWNELKSSHDIPL